MYLSDKFISATTQYNTIENHVNAPLLRREFNLERVPNKATVTITALGFYRLFINGIEITKGILAPYITNPEKILCYDSYDITDKLCVGKNALCTVLGNGMQNVQRDPWDFYKAVWRSAPKMAVAVEADGDLLFEADGEFICGKSAITFDDMRCGEHYDARLCEKDWAMPHFTAEGFTPAISVNAPKGKKKLVEAPPITIEREVAPVSVKAVTGGYIYDFGVNTAGLFRMKLSGATAGQQLKIQCGEVLRNGELHLRNITFLSCYTPGYVQECWYTARGDKEESYTPSFAYFGYRYLQIKGITAGQAAPQITMLVAHSQMDVIGTFECSCDTLNTLQRVTQNSDLSNFFYFPTDCPQREKNGWMGDAAVSSEQFLLNFDCASSLKEWLCHVRAAQREDGALPGIVPTDTWGFKWGNGPAWDAALTYLPYFIYRYTGDKSVAEDNAAAIERYLHYVQSRRNGDGLIAIGLGDWLQPGRSHDKPNSPLDVTDSITCISIAQKAAALFRVAGKTEALEYALNLERSLKEAIRKHRIDFSTIAVAGECQTSQALCLYYDIFTKEEQPTALRRLFEFIKRDRTHLNSGMIGLRVIFHTLSRFDYSNIAYDMITAPDWPSYKDMLNNDATALWESFLPVRLTDNGYVEIPYKKMGTYKQPLLHKLWMFKVKHLTPNKFANVLSLNHHFFGDISGWFIKCLAGININVGFEDIYRVDITPAFIPQLSHAKAHHVMPYGAIESGWKRDRDKVTLTVRVPPCAHGTITLPNGYVFEDGGSEKPLDGTITEYVAYAK